jgi:hypothetical protein
VSGTCEEQVPDTGARPDSHPRQSTIFAQQRNFVHHGDSWTQPHWFSE